MVTKLKLLLNEVQKAPSKLLSETKKAIQKEFPNMPNELINSIINLAKFDEKYALMRDPKGTLDNELSKLSNTMELNLILSSDLTDKELTKIYNLALYNFSSELASLGFEKLKSQKNNFSFDPSKFPKNF